MRENKVFFIITIFKIKVRKFVSIEHVINTKNAKNKYLITHIKKVLLGRFLFRGERHVLFKPYTG